MKECHRFPTNTTIKFSVFKEKCLRYQLESKFKKTICSKCEAGKSILDGERPNLIGINWF